MMLFAASTTPGPWSATAMIATIVLCSTAGEVLTASAMKSIGDLDEIRAHSGMKGAIRAVVTCPRFLPGSWVSGPGVFLAAVCAESSESKPGGTGGSVANAGNECHCGAHLS